AANGLGFARHVKSAYRGPSAGGGQQAAKNADGGRLARAVGAEEAEDLALADFHGDVVDRCEAAELLYQVIDFNCPFSHGDRLFGSVCCSEWRRGPRPGVRMSSDAARSSAYATTGEKQSAKPRGVRTRARRVIRLDASLVSRSRLIWPPSCGSA